MRAGVPHLFNCLNIKVAPGMPFFSVYNDVVTILLAIMLAIGWMLNDPQTPRPLDCCWFWAAEFTLTGIKAE